ncbi:hypothetical protein [Arthrobacter sp. StoSoilB20]|uniref:hypothetical protein n=1 Tax=Arthrobacter sp. StoSoilB20 TaxID=2830995 RepID=UPI001CC7D493|nr:hypothetical protein [Arthrobacter sp. StoSoilB20]BCW58400.1 hypothetical protein StoSoilB20_17470 [Arthrobacter sp. StoSoilB20]
MALVHGFRRSITKAGRAAAYSPAGLEVARAVLATRADSPVRRIIKARGLEGRIRRVASESLPQGVYFAKLTLGNWEAWKGHQFRLLQDGKVVYGNQVEPPARGFPLEYRNIMVTSEDPSRFTIDIDVPYELKIGRGAFTTQQQLAYDERYGVEQHGDVFYSLRGNTKNPKKMLITFPGFGPSTTRISYAVSYLKDLTEVDLQETLMVCFQDRYLVAGSYMMVDNSGRPLDSRVGGAIEGLRSRFNIDAQEMLFFGASKGGSIAIHYAENYPRAALLLAVPQMNLPYYFNKPFFRDNLLQNPALREVEQPEERLRRYLAEGRRIDYFYTNSDELSNHSLIELASDIPNLSKYRIHGGHSDVARSALPAMLCILRSFLSGPIDKEFACEELRTFRYDQSVQVQVRIDAEASMVAGANWFVAGSSGRTRFLQLMTEHSYHFVKYTAGEQSLCPAYDPIDQLSEVIALTPGGTTWTAALPAAVKPGTRVLKKSLSFQPLTLETETTQEYAILDGDTLARFRYDCRALAGDGDTMEIHFAATTDSVTADIPDSSSRTAFKAVVQPLDGWALADIAALRFVIAAGVRRLLLVIDADADPEAVEVLSAIDWEDASVVQADSKEVLAGAGHH